MHLAAHLQMLRVTFAWLLWRMLRCLVVLCWCLQWWGCLWALNPAACKPRSEAHDAALPALFFQPPGQVKRENLTRTPSAPLLSSAALVAILNLTTTHLWSRCQLPCFPYAFTMGMGGEGTWWIVGAIRNSCLSAKRQHTSHFSSCDVCAVARLLGIGCPQEGASLQGN